MAGRPAGPELEADRGALPMTDKTTIPQLRQMKRDGEKIVGVVVWDYQVARIADRAGVEIVSVGDSVGINLWGQPSPLEVTMDEMLTVARGVRRGTSRALLSCDLPYGPLQESPAAAVRAAMRFVREAGADRTGATASPFSPAPAAEGTEEPPSGAGGSVVVPAGSRGGPSSQTWPQFPQRTVRPFGASERGSTENRVSQLVQVRIMVGGVAAPRTGLAK